MNADHMSPAINPNLISADPDLKLTVAKDQLTGIGVTQDNDRFVTVDTSGRIKMHNISRVDFRDPTKTKE